MKGCEMIIILVSEIYCEKLIDKCFLNCMCYMRVFIFIIIVDCCNCYFVFFLKFLLDGILDLWF